MIDLIEEPVRATMTDKDGMKEVAREISIIQGITSTTIMNSIAMLGKKQQPMQKSLTIPQKTKNQLMKMKKP